MAHTAPILPPPPGSFTPIRVRAGGPAYTDPQGQVWAADTCYSGGNAYLTGAAIALTNTPALYQGERWSLTPFQYQFAAPAGAFDVSTAGQITAGQITAGQITAGQITA